MENNLVVYNTLTRKKENFRADEPTICRDVCLRTDGLW